MGFSIQDYLKKINSQITVLDCVSLVVTMLFILAFLMFLYQEKEKTSIPVSYYTSNQEESSSSPLESSQPFASKKGKTYTFSWCQGANRILVKNRIYYKNENDAISFGKVLSKLCQK